LQREHDAAAVTVSVADNGWAVRGRTFAAQRSVRRSLERATRGPRAPGPSVGAVGPRSEGSTKGVCAALRR